VGGDVTLFVTLHIIRPEQPISRILYPVQVTLKRTTIIHLWMAVARHLMRPTRKLGRAALWRFPIWSCTGWGLHSFPGHPENWCALTAPFHPYPAFRRGGMLSVALSFALPRLHVMEHPALRCSDFPLDQQSSSSDRIVCSDRMIFYYSNRIKS